VELTVLGCGGTWADPGGATSGYLLRHDGFTLLVDAGSGTLSRLQQLIPMAEIDAVIVTHAHPDHFVDFYPLFYARYYAHQGSNGLPFYCPDGFFDVFADVVSGDSREAMEEAYSVRPISEGAEFEEGPFRIRSAEMSHIGVHALAYRFEVDGTSLTYSGDTGPTDNLVKLARDSDVLVAEATWQDHMDLLPFHMSATQAGEHATAAGVGALVLTHIWPSLDKADSLDQGAASFEGSLAIAVEGMIMEIGS
jgi:ribonuclease BN (tRNA processing enzyme)